MHRIWLLLLLINCSACATPPVDTPEPGPDKPGHTIYLVSHGWHAGIVLRREEIPGSAWSVPRDFANAEYLEVGWGDMDYYRTPDAHMGVILKAALLPTDSVLHIVGFSVPVKTYFPYSEIIQVELSPEEFTRLTQTIAASFFKNEAGDITSLGPGLYGNSHFYQSRETYHLFNTCNVWTARALQFAGLRITPARAVTVENLMSQVRESGITVQSGHF